MKARTGRGEARSSSESVGAEIAGETEIDAQGGWSFGLCDRCHTPICREILGTQEEPRNILEMRKKIMG
jgi:hypothetical protein